MSGRSVAIVGGGLLGVTAALRLASAGIRPVLFERSADLGGLAGAVDLGGRRVDRFYHVVLPGDDRVLGLAADMGIAELRFRPVGVGFYGAGRFTSMSSVRELATFPLLGPLERARLAAFVARCQTIGDHRRLDETPLLPWLRRLCGRGVVERLWLPLLDSKFDGRVDDLPATYLWARTRRMSGARDRTGHEIMGWVPGGYERLVEAVAARVRRLGGTLHARCAVDRIVAGPGRPTGVVVGGRFEPFDQVLSTLTPPQRGGLLDVAGRLPADGCRYLGVACLVLRTRRSISPYYTLNITEPGVGLTTVVETTHVVDPDHAGGTLVYVARYVDPGHEDLARDADAVAADYLARARMLFPALTDAAILDSTLQRARIVEPVHRLGSAGRPAEHFPVAGLALASTADVYPEIVNGQAVIGVADRVAAGIASRLSESGLAAA
jgi:protoporphyrinogen oxidase